MSVQTLPFSGKPLDFNSKEGANVRLPSPEHGFLLGTENALLGPIIQEILDGKMLPDRQPILLYGEVGTGRSHLLKGILETWRKNQTSDTIRRQAYYSTCADFARQFTESVAVHTTETFRRRYYRAKLILLDDIEQLLGKPAAQRELRLLLDDSFSKESGVIVLTAQTLPMAVKKGNTECLPEDLIMRIQAGTMIPIALPGEAVRKRFLTDLASALGIPTSDALMQTVAKTLIGTIPQLYAAATRKYMEAKSANEPLTLDFWQYFSQKRKTAHPCDIVELSRQTATYFSLKLSDLRGQSRCKTIVLARSLAVYLVKKKLHLTYREIGEFFGKRDPTTVRHLFEKIERTTPTSPELQDILIKLECS